MSPLLSSLTIASVAVGGATSIVLSKKRGKRALEIIQEQLGKWHETREKDEIGRQTRIQDRKDLQE